MNIGKICISVCAKTADELFEKISRAEPLADVIEVRFDCLDPLQIKAALTRLPKTEKKYLLTFRPLDQGGTRNLDNLERTAFWNTAVEKFGEQNVLFDQEFNWHWPENIPDLQTIISVHDLGKPGVDLEVLYPAISQQDCLALKFAQSVKSITDSISVWNLLRAAKSKDRHLIPIAMGEAGKWTRILGLAHGAFMTYASLDKGDETAPGQITAEEMTEVYRVKELNKESEVYGIIAGNTSYSMSPYIQNAAFKAAAMNRVFVPLLVDGLGSFIHRMVRRETREIDLNFRGFSVTNPHKQTIIDHLDQTDETAQKIGAVNTVKIEGNKMTGFNTDAPGFIEPLLQKFADLGGVRAAVIGTGGAARACIYALKNAGAEVVIYARDLKKAQILADEFETGHKRLAADGSLLEADILVNATPIGTQGEYENKTPVAAEQLSGVKLVYDLTYNPRETRLLREAREAGCETLDGLEMLIAQGAKQFEIWTGSAPNIQAMRDAALKRLSK